MKQKSKRKKALCVFLIGNLLPVCYVLWMCFGPPRAITISKETTYLTEPLTDDGRYVDYLAYGKTIIGDHDHRDDLWKAMVSPHRSGDESTDSALKLVPRVTFVDPLEKTSPDPSADGDDAYQLRKSAGQRFETRQMVPFNEEVDPEYADIVRNNEAWCQAIMATDPGAVAVWWEDNLEMVTLPISDVHSRICERLQLRSTLAFGERDFGKVLETFRFLQVVTNRERTVPFIMNQIIAERRIQSSAYATFLGLCATTDIPEPWLREFDSLAPKRGIEEAWSRAMHTDRLVWLDIIQRVHQSRATNGEFTKYAEKFGPAAGNWFVHRVDFDALMRLLNETYDRVEVVLQADDFTSGIAALREDQKAVGKRYPAPASVGVAPTLLDLVTGDHNAWLQFEISQQVGVVEHCLKSIARTQNSWRQLRIAVRLNVFRTRHGHWPESLEQLNELDGWTTPPSILTDSFTNQPFYYQRTERGFVLYSVGPNQQDETAGKDLYAEDFSWEYDLGDDTVCAWPDPRFQLSPTP